MLEHVKRFAQLSGYTLLGTLSLFGMLAILGSGSIGRAAAAVPNQTEPEPPARNAVPLLMNYQGLLRDGDGNLLGTGAQDITFKFYDQAAGGAELYSQTINGVSVRDGRFSTTIDNIPPSVFVEGADRFIGVTVGTNGEMSPREQLTSVPYALQAEDAYNGVPVGGVVDWWRPDASVPVPAGFMLCDGSAVTDPDSPYFGENTPNLIGKMVRGAAPLESGGNEGTSGGSDSQIVDFGNGNTVAQNINTAPAGKHSHDVNGHTGAISTENHGNPGDTDFWVTEFNQGWVQGGHILAEPNNANGEGNHYHSDGTLAAVETPDHTHGVSLPALTLSGTQPIDTIPAHVNLLKLCRTR